MEYISGNFPGEIFGNFRTHNPTDGPFHWSETWRQMATNSWSTTTDLVLPDLDWCRNVSS